MTPWGESLALYETLARLSWDKARNHEYRWRANKLAYRALKRAIRRYDKGLYR